MADPAKINYVEFPASDLGATKAFSESSFPGGRRFHFVEPSGNE